MCCVYVCPSAGGRRFPIPELTREFAVETSAAWVMGVGTVNQVLSREPQGVVPRFDGRQIHPLLAAATDRPHVRADAPRVRASEILFVDPHVSDLRTILANLRPEVEAILLDAERPAARQMAQALEGRDGLDAVHVIAHGAPGRVSFAAGEWSAETLDDDGGDLAAIGRALGGSGELLLWSCNAGAGAAGTNFIDALSCAAGTPVAAASDLVGSPTLGGDWKLNVRTRDAMGRPPLTEVGMGIYAGILVAEVMVTGTLPVGDMGGPVTYYIVDTDQKAIVGQVMLPSAMPRATRVSMAVKVPDATAPLAIGTFDATGNFQPSDILSVNAPAKPTGAVGPSGT